MHAYIYIYVLCINFQYMYKLISYMSKLLSNKNHWFGPNALSAASHDWSTTVGRWSKVKVMRDRLLTSTTRPLGKPPGIIRQQTQWTGGCFFFPHLVSRGTNLSFFLLERGIKGGLLGFWGFGVEGNWRVLEPWFFSQILERTSRWCSWRNHNDE